MINGYSTEAKVAGRLRVTCQYYQRIVCLRQIVGTGVAGSPVYTCVWQHTPWSMLDWCAGIDNGVNLKSCVVAKTTRMCIVIR